MMNKVDIEPIGQNIREGRLKKVNFGGVHEVKEVAVGILS